MSSSVAAVIPARYKSTRFPGKPLVPILGAPMIIHVCRRVERALGKDSVFVATDSIEIGELVEHAGYKSIMTPGTCLTGTDRVAVAARSIDCDVILNVQGDEPALPLETIHQVLENALANSGMVVNAMASLAAHESPESKNIPKVVTTESGRLLYMTRAAVPSGKQSEVDRSLVKKQVCVYGFRKRELEIFEAMKRKSANEAAEDIEILRFLDLSIPVQMTEVSGSSVAVDVPEDIEAAEAAVELLADGT